MSSNLPQTDTNLDPCVLSLVEILRPCQLADLVSILPRLPFPTSRLLDAFYTSSPLGVVALRSLTRSGALPRYSLDPATMAPISNTLNISKNCAAHALAAVVGSAALGIQSGRMIASREGSEASFSPICNPEIEIHDPFNALLLSQSCAFIPTRTSLPNGWTRGLETWRRSAEKSRPARRSLICYVLIKDSLQTMPLASRPRSMQSRQAKKMPHDGSLSSCTMSLNPGFLSTCFTICRH